MGGQFPETEAYLAQLPDGLDSHPQCQVKASLYRSALEARPVPAAAIEELPPVLGRMAAHPHPVSAWVPEVHSLALVTAVSEATCASLEDFERLSYLRQRRLFDSPLYRIAVRLATPNLLLRTATLRWRSIHRGTAWEVDENRPGFARMSMRHPPHLWSTRARVGLTAGFRALVDLCGGRGSVVSVADASESHMTLEGSWR